MVRANITTSAQNRAAPLSQILSDGTTTYLYGAERLRATGGAWYVHDALGSVRTTLDAAGAVVATAAYDPWGTPQDELAGPFGFTGELHHGDQVYLRARWYAPGSGTFPTRDPFAGFPEMPYSLHAYQYAYSNPVLWSDPTGEVPWLLLLGLLLAGGAAAASPAVAYAPPQGVDVAALPPSDTFDDGKAFLATAPGTGDINDVAIVLTGRDLFGEPQDRVLAALAACLPFLTVGALRSLGRVDTGRVLLIGEGDFSFARSVVEQGQSPPRTMVASSYENPPISGAASNTEVLQRRGVRVEPGLDARRLHERVDLGEFDLIVWNFPYQPSSRTDSTHSLAVPDRD